MDKQAKLSEFKKEFAEDIDTVNISVELLKKRKVHSSVLEAETLLRKVLGDEIYVPKKHEEKITGEKEIIKLTEDDMVFDGQVRELCDNIVDVEFDNNLGMLLSKMNAEED